ncbi:Hypothetical protein FKW44_001229 [Caligus rogercresseyi]|uniref:Uncharacterized protein n=1 Tax=Caligus rogercresseyi TaxID=217165 RepID=A0A7T8QVE7_CALRO|nr:Hypothetical protein FKW44_001229 [Caligus rogercresseyi]
MEALAELQRDERSFYHYRLRMTHHSSSSDFHVFQALQTSYVTSPLARLALLSLQK